MEYRLGKNILMLQDILSKIFFTLYQVLEALSLAKISIQFHLTFSSVTLARFELSACGIYKQSKNLFRSSQEFYPDLCRGQQSLIQSPSVNY